MCLAFKHYHGGRDEGNVGERNEIGFLNFIQGLFRDRHSSSCQYYDKSPGNKIQKAVQPSTYQTCTDWTQLCEINQNG